PPQVAVIAQYDNPYGAKSDFHRGYGLEIAKLQVIGAYSVKKNKDLYRLLFDITLKNQGDQPIEEFFFRIFIPTEVKPKEGDEWQILLSADEVWASEHINISNSTIVDGFNRTAQGIDASCQVGTIPAGAITQFIIQMDCRKKAAIGEIYPLLYLLGRQQLFRLWPETELAPAVDPGKQKKFHYLFYNLVIPDRFMFRLTSEGIGVSPVKDDRSTPLS
ncbi:MAG: hypothetical protein L0Y73_00600, partial [Candidatus Aminicenantes bacterium]|nr:hypothetical protein [Candidatus Aminicenantes bacterium]